MPVPVRTTERRDDVRPGDVVLVGPRASRQFTDRSAFRFRVIEVDPREAFEGWVWLTGYQLGPDGNATARRTVFVQPDGLLSDHLTTSASSNVPGKPDSAAVQPSSTASSRQT